MNAWTTTLPSAYELVGDIRPLLEQIGSLPNRTMLAEAGRNYSNAEIRSTEELVAGIRAYQQHILQPVELPAIQRAYLHASRNELRELLSYDGELSRTQELQRFATASAQVGLTQLQRLRPLRDQRLAQRYLTAVERGEANAWHTLVYGLTLAIYSVPLRPGLIGYAQQTTRGFILAAGKSLKLTSADREKILAEVTMDFPGAVDSLIGQNVIA